MRFTVPQFIEVEDKIFGPLSFRQFTYIAGGVGFVVIIYTYFGFVIAILLGLPFFAFGFLLAFYKVNNRPFISLLQAALYYVVNKKLYLWKQLPKQKKKVQKKEAPQVAQDYVPNSSKNKLKDLAWSLDIKESMYENKEQVTN